MGSQYMANPGMGNHGECDDSGNCRDDNNYRLNRRDALGLLGVLIAGLALPRSGKATFEDNACDADGFAKRIAALLGFDVSVSDARSASARVNAELLSDILQLDVTKPETIGMSDARLKQRIVGQMTVDYSHEKVVNIGGWWISLTEAKCLQFVASMNGSHAFYQNGVVDEYAVG